jgi:hypothetical protein
MRWQEQLSMARIRPFGPVEQLQGPPNLIRTFRQVSRSVDQRHKVYNSRRVRREEAVGQNPEFISVANSGELCRRSHRSRSLSAAPEPDGSSPLPVLDSQVYPFRQGIRHIGRHQGSAIPLPMSSGPPMALGTRRSSSCSCWTIISSPIGPSANPGLTRTFQGCQPTPSVF